MRFVFKVMLLATILPSTGEQEFRIVGFSESGFELIRVHEKFKK